MADTVTKDFISDASVFADVFNYYIYGGEPVIQPEQLTERDPTAIALPYGSDGAAVPVQRFRDVQKMSAAMTDGEWEYVLYSAENQSEVHYAMVVRNYLYDALDYVGQVEAAAKSHQEALKRQRERRKRGEAVGEGNKKLNHGEFLGGFWKGDRLIPSVTLTIHFSHEEWDGPLSLFDMLAPSDLKLLSLMDNYHLHLISPARMTDEEIMKFRSSLREVMLFIKYSKDQDQLQTVLEANGQRLRALGRRAVEVIEAVTHSGIKCEESEDTIDVCQAIKDMKLESRMMGERIGEKRGVKKGVRKGVGIGELKRAKESAGKLLADGFSYEQVSKYTGLPVDVVGRLGSAT